ncbi:MAG: protein kinase [Pyrinomonadaceae bacterium]
MPNAGENISHYKIISAIGAGGMGEVFLAEDTKLERQVALKILLAEVADDDERVRRFVQEAKAASALNHPNILTVFEIGSFNDSQYIATEYIKGKTLRHRMRESSMSLDEALGIALQVATALAAAHEAGIIHRDIKPDNIMIRDDGVVKVLDFGLAKLTEKHVETAAAEAETKAQFNTEPGMIMGTAAYMSPEQARGHTLDPRSDIFSLGIVLYELFTSKRPFDGESHLDVISSILKDEPQALRLAAPALPRHLERIVDKTLRKDRDHRYQHVKDLQIDLQDLRDELKFEAKLNQTADQSIPAQLTGSEGPRSTFTERISATRRFTLLHAIVFIAIVGLLVGGIWYFRPRPAANVIAGSLKTTEIANWSSAPGELFSNASFSPDGKMIAFSSTKSSAKNIWVTQTVSTEAIQVTNDAFSNQDPIWSPKGDELAFFSQKGNIADGKGNATGVWRVSALGGTPKSVGPVADGSFQLRRWAASGKIYYQSKGDLYTMDVASGMSQKATSFDPQKGKLIWASISTDEKTLAFITQKDNAWELFTSDPTAADPTSVTKGTGEISGVAWLPEKERFYYSASVDGVFQVFVAGSGTPTRLTSSETDSIVVDAAPDGSSVIVSSAKEESTIWRVNVTDKVESPVSRNVNSELWPDVSPDGQKMVFQSAKNLSRGNKLLESTILVKGLRSRDDPATTISEAGFLPAWSPDGNLIAFMRKAGEVPELMVANPNGGGERKLAAGGIPMAGYSVSPYNHIQTNAFAWSPDSSRIAYISNKNGTQNLWAVNARDGSDAPLTANTDNGLTFACPVWSSDGKRLAFSTKKDSSAEGGKKVLGLGMIDTATGQTTNFYETSITMRLIGWTADENGLIIAESEKTSGLPPETVLKKVTAGTGTASEISRLKNAYYYNIFVSNDRKWAGYVARNDERDDVWVIATSGGDAKRLTNNNDSGQYFSRLAWLHDGSTIMFGKQTRFSLLSMLTTSN